MVGNERGFSAGAVILSFLAGAAAGAVVALLTAPQTGRESREQLGRYARRTEEKLREAAGQAGEAIDRVVEKGREFVQEKKSVLTEAIEAGREAMRRERERLSGDRPS
jgi:gas vesicle protein